MNRRVVYTTADGISSQQMPYPHLEVLRVLMRPLKYSPGVPVQQEIEVVTGRKAMDARLYEYQRTEIVKHSSGRDIEIVYYKEKL